MLEVAEAQALVLQHVRPLPPETAGLGPGVLGRVLAEDVASDLDVPPFDKSLMDGYAVRAADLPDGRATLSVVEEITAGRTPRVALGPGQATRIMTGAPIPSGADAVVVVEKTRLADGERVQIDDKPPRPEQNILRQGREMRRGEVVLKAGTMLRPAELGLLATVGRSTALLHPLPHLAHLTTGDELVETDTAPGPGQIRNGNSPMLLGQAAAAGAVPYYLGIGLDRVDSLRPLIEEGLRYPVLVLSGGVSAGKLDLVPGVLRALGVEAHFHKISMKPGKPAFFGRRGDTLVFGLPGNPVSAMVCFELFVRPAIRRLAGHTDPGTRPLQAKLAEDFAYATDRPTYHPAWLEEAETGRQVRPVAWFGSADLRGLTRANALMLLPVGDQRHRAGQVMAVWRIGPFA